MNKDPFYHFFESCLNCAEMASLNSEDFATQVSHAYIEVLRRKGLVVPASESEKIFESLREDALIMYRMKTYGFYNLGEYQNKKKAS